MARVAGSAWPWLLADDSERIIGVRAPASYFFPMNAGDYAEVVWQTPSTDVSLEIKAANGGPAVPSVFLTMARIS